MGGCASRPPAPDSADFTRAASRGSWVTEAGPIKGHVSWRSQGPKHTAGAVLSAAEQVSKSFRGDIKSDKDHKHGVVEGLLSRIASRWGSADAPKGSLHPAAAVGKTTPEGTGTPPSTASADSRHKQHQDESLLEDLEAVACSGVSGSNDSFEAARTEAVRELERKLSKRHGPAGQAWLDEEEYSNDDIGENGFEEHADDGHVEELVAVGPATGLRRSRGGEQQVGRQAGAGSGRRPEPEGELTGQGAYVQRIGGDGLQAGQQLEVLGVTEPGEEQQQQQQRPHSRAAILRPRLMKGGEDEEEGPEGRSAGSGGGYGVLMQGVPCLPNSVFGKGGDDDNGGGSGGGGASGDTAAAAAAAAMGSGSGRAAHRHSETSYLNTQQLQQQQQDQGQGLAARGARKSDLGIYGHNASRIARAVSGEADEEENELVGRGSRGPVRAPAPPLRHNLMAAPLMQQLRQQAEAGAAAPPRQLLDYTPSPGAAVRAKSALRGQPSRASPLSPGTPQQQQQGHHPQASDTRVRLDYVPTKSFSRRGANALANASASSTPASPPAALPSAPSGPGSNLSNNTCSHFARAATATTLTTTGTAATANCQSPSDPIPAGILSARASTGQATFVTDRLHSGTHAALLPTSASCYGLAAAAKAPHKTFLSPRGTADSGSGPRVDFAALASPALSPQAANTVLSPRVTALAAASSRAPSRPSSPRCFAGGGGGGSGSSSSDGGAAGGAAAALQQLLQQHHYAPGPTDRADQQPKVAFAASASAAAAVPRGGGGSGSGSRVSGGGGDVVTGETERPQQGTLGHASLARDRASRLLATMARLRSEGG